MAEFLVNALFTLPTIYCDILDWQKINNSLIGFSYHVSRRWDRVNNNFNVPSDRFSDRQGNLQLHFFSQMLGRYLFLMGWFFCQHNWKNMKCRTKVKDRRIPVVGLVPRISWWKNPIRNKKVIYINIYLFVQDMDDTYGSDIDKYFY